MRTGASGAGGEGRQGGRAGVAGPRALPSPRPGPARRALHFPGPRFLSAKLCTRPGEDGVRCGQGATAPRAWRRAADPAGGGGVLPGVRGRIELLPGHVRGHRSCVSHAWRARRGAELACEGPLDLALPFRSLTPCHVGPLRLCPLAPLNSSSLLLPCLPPAPPKCHPNCS